MPLHFKSALQLLKLLFMFVAWKSEVDLFSNVKAALTELVQARKMIMRQASLPPPLIVLKMLLDLAFCGGPYQGVGISFVIFSSVLDP